MGKPLIGNTLEHIADYPRYYDGDYYVKSLRAFGPIWRTHVFFSPGECAHLKSV
jgi:hypothetical protein